MFTSNHQNAGHSHNTKTVNISLENVIKLKYFGTTLTSLNEEIKSK
jgi:hypothetical protein